MSTNPDIDIDVADRTRVLEKFKHTKAILNDDKIHNTGVYFHKVPENPYTGHSLIDYKKADDYGFFKIDVLNINLYKRVKDNNHMKALMDKEPLWEMLEEKKICDQLFHMSGHHGVCQKMKPSSVLELAAVLSIIRPAKRHLIGKSWEEVFETVWEKPEDGSYAFRKSHAIAYSLAVVVNMNLLEEENK